jgi:hypothetical protein
VVETLTLTSRRNPSGPSPAQVRATRAVTQWYLARHFRRPDDAGTPRMFTDPERVGSFAVTEGGLRSGDDASLFRLLVATAMFQRRQDVQILRILRGINEADAMELTTQSALAHLAGGGCDHSRTNESLLSNCDLTKDAKGLGACSANPTFPCHLKRHTVLMKRYGHFGKVPTSIALTLAEYSGSLNALRESVLRAHDEPRARAVALESSLSVAWRVSQKIASMFLSAVTNPDLLESPAWSAGLDWTYYVVIDSNVDLFLASIGYSGPSSYDARRGFVMELAQRIDLRALVGDHSVQQYNPRLVQQAMYLFMSSANRRAISSDCSQEGAPACRQCPRAVATRCPLRA